MPYISKPPIERFRARYVQNDETGCWEWQRNLMKNGYGRFCLYADGSVLAHRFAYEHFVGPIPEGMHVDHLCRNRRCVNPDHLEAVTPTENNIRSVPFRKKLATETHCANGHRWTDKTRYVSPSGTIACRACRNEAQLRYKGKAA